MTGTTSAMPLGFVEEAGCVTGYAGGERSSATESEGFLLVIPVRGRCAYEDVRHGRRVLGPGDACIVCPGTQPRYRTTGSTGWDVCIIRFGGPVFACWQSQGLIAPDRPFLRLQPLSYWLARFRGCFDRVGLADDQATALRNLCAFQSVLAEALTHAGAIPSTQASPAWLQQACAALDARSSNDRRLSALARDLGMPFETFRKRFAAAVGMSPGAYRSARRIDEARRLILAGTPTSRAVADLVGFRDEHYFSRRFRQIVGMTPTAFRHRFASGQGRRSVGSSTPALLAGSSGDDVIGS